MVEQAVKNVTCCNARAGPAAFAVVEAARQSETFEDAVQRLGVVDLGAILAESPALRAAWDRGRFLRRLAEFGRAAFCRAEVARRLGLDNEIELQRLFEKDPESADVFQRARDSLCTEARAALVKSAEAGHAGAVRALERLLHDEGGHGSDMAGAFDHTTIPVGMMETITGISRVQWGRWATVGLPQNPDGSFSLPSVFAWLRHNPTRAGTRPYRRKPHAVVRRLQQRVNILIEQELSSMKGLCDDEQ